MSSDGSPVTTADENGQAGVLVQPADDVNRPLSEGATQGGESGGLLGSGEEGSDVEFVTYDHFDKLADAGCPAWLELDPWHLPGEALLFELLVLGQTLSPSR